MEAASKKMKKEPKIASSMIQLSISSFFNAGTAKVSAMSDPSSRQLAQKDQTCGHLQADSPDHDRISMVAGECSVETEAPGAATGKPGHTERQRRTVTQCAENCKPDGRLPFKSCSRYPTTPAFAGELCQKLPHRSELPAPGPCSQSLSTQRPAINTTASLEATKTEVQEAETVSDLTPHVETDFEKERAERILRNKMILAELGLQDNFMTKTAGSTGNKRKMNNCRATLASSREKANLPLRRSSRMRAKTEPQGSDHVDCAAEAAVVSAEQSVEFEDSRVLKYYCDGGNGCRVPALTSHWENTKVNVEFVSSWWDEGRGTKHGHLEGYHTMKAVFGDWNLTRAYGMDTHAGLLAAGGHRGVVSVWGNRHIQECTDADADCEPLMSAQLDRGWICDVQFVRSGTDDVLQSGSSSLPLLLTASNSAVVALWDISKTSDEGMPHKLLENTCTHSGGIFSMQTRGTSVLTASKDCTVAVSSIRSEGASMELNCRLDFHTGVVKCARWRDDNVVSSCGTDRTICLHDLRISSADGKPSTATITNTHSGPVNYLQWNPFNDSLLLSSGGDKAIQVYDVRNSNHPIHTFCGHMQKGQSIYQPLWTDSGRAIVTGGDTAELALYDCETGIARSRGYLGFDPKATLMQATIGPDGHVLYLATSKRIVVCAASWKALE